MKCLFKNVDNFPQNPVGSWSIVNVGVSCSELLGNVRGVCGVDFIDDGVDDVDGVTPDPGFFNIKNSFAPSLIL